MGKPVRKIIYKWWIFYIYCELVYTRVALVGLTFMNGFHSF